MKKLIIGITAPGSVILIDGQLQHFKALGYETYLLAPPDERVTAYCQRENCIHLPVAIQREISLVSDLKALYKIYRHFKKVKPDIVNLGTPKVSLLGMLAAKLVGVKNRIYTCRGFRFENEIGKKKKVLIFMEKLTAGCSHKVICISQSLKDLGVDYKIFSAAKSVVIHKGSSNGFDFKRFSVQAVNQDSREELIDKLKIRECFTYGFVGRIGDRKGIKELFEAFGSLYEANNNIRLVVVGSVDHEQILDKSLIEKYNSHPGIVMTGSQYDVPLYMSVMDVFVLPTWNEGFGNVLVQAAAMQLPVISTNVTGSRDAVSNGFNGLLVKGKSVEELKAAMLQLQTDADLRNRLGKNGLEWAPNFDNKIIWDGMNKLYQNR